MSFSGDVLVLQQLNSDNIQNIKATGGSYEDSLTNGHCMYPANAINGQVGSAGNLLAHQSPSIPGSSEYNLSSFTNRSHVPAGLVNIFPNKELNARPASFEHKNDALYMPSSGNSGGPTKFMAPPPAPSGAQKLSFIGKAEGTAMLNDNEFPSLISRPPPTFPTTSYHLSTQHQNNPNTHITTVVNQPIAGSGRQAYANLMNMRTPSMTSRHHTDQSAEFRIQSEDFPALPGASQNSVEPSVEVAPSSSGADVTFPGDKKPAQVPKKGIQTHPDGTVTGIPPGMLSDQFGMAGLLTFLRAIETDPSIVALALGHDLTTLGLNLNAPEKNLYANFGGPWADYPCKAQDIDYHVPEEYLTNAVTRDKLPPIKLNRYQDDLLFHLFYNFPNDVLQMAAAAELYNRDWRYHKEERVWLTRAAGGGSVIEQTGTYERGTYYLFDASHWRKVAKEMVLEYSKLEERPQLPPQLLPQQQPLPQQQAPSGRLSSAAAGNNPAVVPTSVQNS